MLPSLLRKQNNKLRVVPKQKRGMTMKKKMIALTCSLIFANTIPVFAASDYGINIDQIRFWRCFPIIRCNFRVVE